MKELCLYSGHLIPYHKDAQALCSKSGDPPQITSSKTEKWCGGSAKAYRARTGETQFSDAVWHQSSLGNRKPA